MTTADEAGLVAVGTRAACRLPYRKARTPALQTAIEDVTDPTNLVTKPLGEAGKLPCVSSLAADRSTEFGSHRHAQVNRSWRRNAPKSGTSSSTGNVRGR